jgi:hypothetical protein
LIQFDPRKVLIQFDPREVLVQFDPREVLVQFDPREVLVLTKTTLVSLICFNVLYNFSNKT